MNLNTRLYDIKSCFHSLCLILTLMLTLPKGAYSQEITFRTYSNTEITYTDTGTYCIVLKNNLSCLHCFYPLDSALREIIKEKQTQYWLAVKSDSSSYTRKKNISTTKKELPNAHEYFAYYSTEENDSALNILITPALLLIHSGKHKIYPYKVLLGSTGTTIPDNIINEIKNFIQ